MAKYMFKARYTGEGAKGVMAAGGTARREAVAQSCASAGGKLESFYYAFGDVDAYVICDLPDDITAAALSMAVASSGLAATSTVKLLSPEDMDKVTKTKVSYRPPGK